MVSYEVVNTPPEGIFEKCHELWGVDFNTTVFTVGNKIHSKHPLTEDLLAHEVTHVGQQTAMGDGVWWDRYFVDPAFRMEQELEAYRNQYKWVTDTFSDRNKQASYLVGFARSLSGTMYGNLITFTEAMQLIKSNAR